MYLSDLISMLEKYDAKTPVRWGFGGEGHSDRGDYSDLAFEEVENTTTGEMVQCLKKRLGTTIQGYKGGDYKVSEGTKVLIGEDSSCCGHDVSPLLIKYMVHSSDMVIGQSK